MRRIFICSLLVTIFFFQLQAEEIDLYFKHLNTENGLSSNMVNCIYQDSRGFIWIGTDDGLNRYDGYEFIFFKYNSADTNSLSSNSVFKILEDSQGRLWVGASQGIDIFDRENNSFIHIPFFDEDIEDKYSSYTRDIIEDHSGNIIIANSVGVFIYDPDKKGFERYLKGIVRYGSSQVSGIRAMLIDRKNRIWIGSLGYGLYGYDLEKKQVIASPDEQSGIKINDRIWDISEDPNGDIWVGTEQGIYIIKADLSEKSKFKDTDELGELNFRSIYFQNGSDVWIGTNGGGLYHYNKQSGHVHRFIKNEFDNNSLSHNSVRYITIDKQGILWLGTYQGGVNYTQVNRNKQFDLIRNQKGNTNSLSNNVVSAFYEDSQGIFWIGTDGGGLNSYDINRNKYTHYLHDPDDPTTISSNAVLIINEDRKGNIWMGGYLMGINILNKKTGRISRIMHDPSNLSSLPNNDVRDILIENDTAVWIATNGGGLCRYNPVTGLFRHFRMNDMNPIASDWCLKLYLDSKDNLWLGTYDGISVFSPDRNTITNYTESKSAGSLSNGWVYCFAEDIDSGMWIGTANGLNYFDNATRKFEQVLPIGGAVNEVINGILIDDNNMLWLSTNNGIVQFDPVKKDFLVFDENDGLQGKQFIHGSYYKATSGEMYFGGLNGYNKFYPENIENNSFIPPVYLTDLLIFYQKAEIGEKGSPLEKSITESEQITLSHHQSVVTFEYAALNYVNSEKNQYAYMLEGFDKDWIHVGTRREATYTNLSRGKYVFRVKGSNNDGVWNETGTSLKVVVLPPWWKTIWFQIILGLSIISLILLLYRYRLRALNRQKLHLENMVQLRTREIREKNKTLQQQAHELSSINKLLAERTEQIELQAQGLSEANTLLEERQQHIEEQTEELLSQKEELVSVNDNLKELNSTKDKFFSIIAHDLKNPFNTILGFSELLSNNFAKLTEDKKIHFANIIYRSAQNVFELLENLLQWARSQTNRLTFDPVEIDLNALIKENIKLLSATSKQKKIELVYSLNGDSHAFADKNMISTVIRNLLSNAIKFSNKGDKINIDLNRKESVVEVSVRDQGIGISADDIDKLFRVDTHFTREGTSGEGGTGLGLLLCREYILKNEGKIWVDSAVGEGSVFTFSIPVKLQA